MLPTGSAPSTKSDIGNLLVNAHFTFRIDKKPGASPGDPCDRVVVARCPALDEEGALVKGHCHVESDWIYCFYNVNVRDGGQNIWTNDYCRRRDRRLGG